MGVGKGADFFFTFDTDGEIAAYRIGENSLIDFQKEAVGLDFEVYTPYLSLA